MKQHLNNYIIVILFFFLVSCNSTSKKYIGEDITSFSIEDFKDEKHLKGNIIELEDLDAPSIVQVKDSILFVINSKGDKFLNLFNLNNGKKIREIVDVGSGPDELIMCTNLQLVDSTLFLADMQQNRILIYNHEELLNTEIEKPTTSLSIQVENVSMQSTVYLSTDRYATYNPLEGVAPFCFFNKNGDKTEFRTSLPQMNSQILDTYLLSRIFENRMTTNTSRNKIYVSYSNTDIIDIYNDDGSLEKRIQGPDILMPSLVKKEIQGGGIMVVPTRENKLTYFSPIATEHELWVLYYGKSPIPYTPFSSSKIFVFSETGTPLVIYHLDTPIFNFCVDKKNKCIYGIANDPDYEIVKFDY